MVSIVDGSNKSFVVCKKQSKFRVKTRASICFIFGLYQQNERLFDEIWGLNSQLVILHMIYVGEKSRRQNTRIQTVLSLWNNKRRVHHNHFGRMKRKFEHLNSWGKKCTNSKFIISFDRFYLVIAVISRKIPKSSKKYKKNAEKIRFSIHRCRTRMMLLSVTRSKYSEGFHYTVENDGSSILSVFICSKEPKFNVQQILFSFQTE